MESYTILDLDFILFTFLYIGVTIAFFMVVYHLLTNKKSDSRMLERENIRLEGLLRVAKRKEEELIASFEEKKKRLEDELEKANRERNAELERVEKAEKKLQAEEESARRSQEIFEKEKERLEEELFAAIRWAETQSQRAEKAEKSLEAAKQSARIGEKDAQKTGLLALKQPTPTLNKAQISINQVLDILQYDPVPEYLEILTGYLYVYDGTKNGKLSYYASERVLSQGETITSINLIIGKPIRS